MLSFMHLFCKPELQRKNVEEPRAKVREGMDLRFVGYAVDPILQVFVAKGMFK